MWFKYSSNLALAAILFSAKQNGLCNFGRGEYDEQFSEIILNLGKWSTK